MDLQAKLHQQLEEIKEQALAMAALVQTAIQEAFFALFHNQPGRAELVVAGDRRIDLTENELDRKALALLGTQQPMARDLRFLAATVRVGSCLERMADQAVNLAERALALAKLPPAPVPDTIYSIFDVAREMTRAGVEVYRHGDVAKGYWLLARDQVVDELARQFLESNLHWMHEERRPIARGVELILASRHLERIADGACNLAELGIYIATGEVARHHPVPG